MKRVHLHLLSLSVLITVALTGLNGGLTGAIAAASPFASHTTLRSTDNTLLLAGRSRRLQLRLGVRSSVYRGAAFTRGGSCSEAGTEQITALVPATRPEEVARMLTDSTVDDYAAVDYTLSRHPIIFAYVSGLEPGTEIQFTLQEEWEPFEELHNVRFTVDGSSGIIGVRVPEDVTLEPDTLYRWYMAIDCNADDPAENPIIGSVIQRPSNAAWLSRDNVDMSILMTELNQAEDTDKPAIYAEMGIWQDALSSLAKLRYDNPNNTDIHEDWVTLMEEADMPQFINVPILQIQGN